MGQSTEEILLRVGLDANGMKMGVARLVEDQKKSTNQIKEMWSSLGKFIGGAAILGGINSLINKFDDLQDRADNLGIGTEFLQGMSQISSQNAVGGVESFNKAIAELSVRLGNAKDGAKDSVAIFQKYGITLADIQNLDSEQMFYLIADRIAAIQDPAKRTAAAFDLLGKSGKNMTGVLSEGSAGLKKMVDQVDKLDAASVKALADAKDVVDEYKNLATVTGAKVLLGLTKYGPEALGEISTGGHTVFNSHWEKGQQRADADAAARSAKIDAEIATESAEKRATAEKRIADAADYSQRAAEGKAQQEKEAAEALQKQVSMQRELGSLYDRASAIKNDAAKVDAASVTVGDLAGRDFTAGLNADYGAGGRYDLGKGDGVFGNAARESLRAEKQMQWDLTYGNGGWVEGKDGQAGHFTGAAEQDRQRKIKADNMLGAAGLDTPAQKFEAMKKSLNGIQKDIAKILSNGIPIIDPPNQPA